ncbi:chromosome partitioning protein [Pseudoclavibacter sp. RFBJ3]|uniref:polysaccharide biosynthesis tyrosine autokinase n=1 Tax=unclassified Pseudoclavibacter TaxID=2615177 RepID=UPI000CE771BD|nr:MULTISPECIES: polysaccharide biosynthesis tyrosine autokinase [unclassified Pseudoclavibacter]MBF4550381.1 polysaccharide biosynthesis tyrosine autokinase [Pseudoclavibacter sp. VKM Ac-2888]PPF34324.1 chromosome partitioning protein [Pseudoclavibacter sp. AY1H1]PPF77753.1 chromosome partitioning protein [Pseudoclavibacter sp. Z016]PPF81938.1 chromosome partitioning protein [Pseudoclavibacter sp. RFBJ5]PPF95436.1 chromosome partitioning protein [Pseudoclavibacter sp. RFBJ3]
MELRDYLRILHKNWIIILICTLAGVAGGAGVSLLQTPKYSSTAELYVSVRSSDGAVVQELNQGTSFARQAVQSYTTVVNKEIVTSRVIAELGLNMTPAELASKITATNELNTVVIEIAVTDEDPVQAASIANSVATNFIDVIVNELEKPDGASPSLVKIEPVQSAQPSGTAVSPRVPMNVGFGALIGLLVGLGIAFLRQFVDTKVRSTHDIAQITDRPIIGTITFDPDAGKRPLIVHEEPKSPKAESYRALRTNLRFMDIENTRHSFVVTSSLPSEGKSTTSANIAIALAEQGAKVVLVDGDLRKPKVATTMGVDGSVGLTDLLSGRAEPKDVLQRWGRGRLYVLPAGRIPPNPSELLGSHTMQQVHDQLLAEHDYVIIDAPPLLLVTDGAVLSELAHGTLLVVASGQTPRSALAGAVAQLEGIGSEVSGIVVTKVPTKGPDSYAYGSYGAYGAYYGTDEAGNPTTEYRKIGTGQMPIISAKSRRNN